MAILDLLTTPNPILKQPCDPITEFDVSLSDLIQDMLDTMNHYKGVGLAAPQVGILQRIFVCRYKKEELVCINPTLTPFGSTIESEEACLSIPDENHTVLRKEHLKIRAFDATGTPFSHTYTNFMAIIMQHENDHLDGKLISDNPLSS